MCWSFWLDRDVWENSFDMRFLCTKVGVWTQKLHELEILKMQNFAWTCPNLRATYIFPVLPGAARCALASLYGSDMTCRDCISLPASNSLSRQWRLQTSIGWRDFRAKDLRFRQLRKIGPIDFNIRPWVCCGRCAGHFGCTVVSGKIVFFVFAMIFL